MKKYALQIGAGNIGRALVGEVLHEAGYHITFADVVETLIEAINQKGSYQIDIVSANGTEKKTVSDIDAISSLDETAMFEHIAQADIITTAVGVNILPRVAPVLARGLMNRLQRDITKPLVVIACENVVGNTSILLSSILSELPDDTWRTRVQETVSFPDCAVDRIVPNVDQKTDDPLTVVTEQYYQIAVDQTKIIGPVPNIPGFSFVENIDATLAQKLFTFNGVHAAAAYFGYQQGIQTIDQAVADPDIRAKLVGFLDEVSSVVSTAYPSITPDAQKQFAEKTLARIANPYLRDTPSRVGRDLIRKLGHDDRLVKPALLALSYGQTPTYCVQAIAAGFHFDNPDDPQASSLKQRIASVGITQTAAEVMDLDPNDTLIQLVTKAYSNL